MLQFPSFGPLNDGLGRMGPAPLNKPILITRLLTGWPIPADEAARIELARQFAEVRE